MPAGQVLFEPFIIINKVFSLKSNYLSLFTEKLTSIWIASCSFLCFGRNRHPKLFCNKVVLRNFANFTGKHLFQSLFFNKVGAGISPAILLKKRLRKMFSCKFFEIYSTPPMAVSVQSGDTIFLILSRLFDPVSAKYSPSIPT